MLDEEQVCAKRAEFINGFTGGGGEGGIQEGCSASGISQRGAGGCPFPYEIQILDLVFCR